MTRTRVVLAPNPSVFTGPGTNTYLLGDGDGALVCIDPGPDDPGHLEAILAAATAMGGSVARILLTHSHPDHRPLARALAQRTGAPIWCHDPGRGDDGAEALADGAVVATGGVVLHAVHTPGHAGDHLCFHDPAAGALYSGDHILSGMTTVINPPDGDMTAYLDSLHRVLALRPGVIHPAHGGRLDDGVGVVEQYIAHRLQREAQVVEAARRHGAPVTAGDLVPEIYAGYPEALYPLAARSVEAHLLRLVRLGRATAEGDRYVVG